MREIWKDIPGYEGLYQASTLGRIKKLSTFLPDKNGKRCHRKACVLKQNIWKPKSKLSTRRKTVYLYKDGVKNTAKVHRLIALTFIPNPENKPDINHKDGNGENNKVDNLEWVTKNENMWHARYVLGHQNGFRNKSVKCVETEEIFSSTSEAAKAKKVDQSSISRAANGRLKRAAGYHWKFVN